ncbi:MAG: restriction endonuclease subunit S [Burkholderiales bacterium]|nr:restriction endonuclease subunit S [Burkholderiales bacterium]
MSFAGYPAYVDSGIQWVGMVPEHWQVTALVGIAAERYESNAGLKDDNLLSLSYGRVVRKDIDSNDGLLPESFETYQIVHPGDIVLRLTDLQNDKRSLRSAHVEERGIITSAYLALQPIGVAPRFLSHLLRAYDTKKVFYSMGGGLRQSMKFADLKRMPVAVPTKTEQITIAEFLDRETAKIDALVEEQRRLIELLKEKRQAVISQAVTKGLDPNVPMKDSGVEWLGDVPAHWKVGKSGYYVSVLAGYAFPSADFSLNDCDAKLLRGINVGVGELRWEDVVYWVRQPSDGLDPYELVEGDLVVGMDRPLIANGMRVAHVTHLDSPCLLVQRVAKVQPGPLMESRFIMRLLGSRAFEAHFAPETTGVSVPHISGEQICRFLIPVPPLVEQRRICDFVDLELAKLNALNHEAELATALLGERRSALISAAVTGKIDVRGLAQH